MRRAGTRFLSWLSLAVAAASAEPPAPPLEVVDIASVWAGHPVGFALLTQGDQQFVAFYDADRRMTLAQRSIGSKTWRFKVLQSTLAWDSHNYITMALDRGDHLHVSGNMHGVPLVYFRGGKPLDIESVEPIAAMTGKNEKRVTYPAFYKGPAGALVFSHRDGGSGDGNNFLNIYDEKSLSWSRLIEKPLMDGRGLMNAYMNGPDLGPDGYYHACWVWRDTPDASTCHDLGYMRSKDLRHWETIAGKPVVPPVTVQNADVLVDAIPSHGGIINGCARVGFDARNKVLISYHKFDPNGKTQLYIARFDGDKWAICQSSNWDYRWDFGGGGSLVSEIHLGRIESRDGRLRLFVSHRKEGSGTWELDPATLRLDKKVPADDGETAFRELRKVQSAFPDMEVRWSRDLQENATGSRLRWETLPANRDRPHDPPWPPPSQLQLVTPR